MCEVGCRWIYCKIDILIYNVADFHGVVELLRDASCCSIVAGCLMLVSFYNRAIVGNIVEVVFWWATSYRLPIVVHILQVVYCCTHLTGCLLLYTSYMLSIVVHILQVVYCCTLLTSCLLFFTSYTFPIVLHILHIFYSFTPLSILPILFPP